MEPNQQLESSVPTPEVLEKKPKNPARKWLMVSGFGIMLCIISLGVHVLRGGSSNPEPLSKKVLSQVFGFTPYYFSKDIPPDHLKLDTNSAKFLSNQLTYIMTDSKQEKITISQQTAPATIKNMEGESAQTTLGTATIKTGSGQISAQVVTSDKTLITLHASDFISSGTLIDIYNSMHTVSKGVQVTP